MHHVVMWLCRSEKMATCNHDKLNICNPRRGYIYLRFLLLFMFTTVIIITLNHPSLLSVRREELKRE